MRIRIIAVVLLISLFVLGTAAIAQVATDYRSKATGNWSDPAIWETFDGSTWSAASVKPGAANNVYVQYSHIVTLTGTEACGDLHCAVTDGGSGVTAGIVKLGGFTLQLNGKIRVYSAPVGTLPGTNAGGAFSWGSTKWPIQSGTLQVVGNSRALTVTGEWGAGSSTAGSYAPTVDVALNAGQTVTLNSNIKFGDWTFTSGTFNAQGNTVSADIGSATTLKNITIGPNATYVTSATNCFQRTSSALIGTLTNNGTLVLTGATPKFAATTVVMNGTVQYDNAGAQALAIAYNSGASPTTYSNLNLSNSGVKTLGLNTTVNGTLTLAGTASLALGGFTLAYGPSAGLEYAGSNAQTTSAVECPSTLTNLKINNASGVVLDATRTVTGTLSLQSGALTTGSYTLALGSSGMVTRTAGYVNGFLQKAIPAGASTQSFEIGDASNYAPVSVAFGNVSTPGTVTASTTSGLHPQIASSGLLTDKTLNRYYTLTNSGTVYDSYNATFNFVPADVIGGAATSNYIVKKYDTGTWSAPVTANPFATSIQATGVTSMSDFAVGESSTPPSYTLTMNASNGTIAANPPAGPYTSGTMVTLTAAPAAGYHFTGWSGDLVSINNPDSILMSGNKSVTANFAIDQFTITASTSTGGLLTPSGAVTVNYGSSQEFTFAPSTGHHFDSLLVNGLKIDTASTSYTFTNVISGPQTIAAYFSINTYTLGVTSVGTGTVTKDPDQPSYDYGTSVQLTATPGSGEVFVGWSGDASGSANPLSVVLDANKSITATFASNTFTISASGVNGIVTKSPDQTSYTAHTQVTLTAVPSTGYHFTGWSGSLTGTTNPATVYTDSNMSVTAGFAIDQHGLNVTAVNGTVAVNPPTGPYNYGTVVTLTATPSTGYHFVGWTGDLTGSANPDSVVMTADRNVTAGFAINTYVINAAVSGNGTITPSGAVSVAYDGSQQFSFAPGAGYHYDSLVVDGAKVDTAAATYLFSNVVSGPQSITAYFSPNLYTLTVSGVNGTVAKNPNQVSYVYHTSVQLTATPAPGYHFTGWSGSVTGSANPVTVNVDSTMTAAANFAFGSTFTWSGGTGNWSVATNWTPNGVPSASDTVYIVTTNPTSIVTIDQDAEVAKLRMNGVTSGATNGSILQFPASGAVTLTIGDSLTLSGGSGTGVQGGRPKLSSNGNASAVLKLLGSLSTSVSNSSTNAFPGMNMHEGTVMFGGSNPATISTSAGLTLGNMVVGDGTGAKTVLFTISSGTTSSQRIACSSFTVKTGSTFLIGGTAVNYGMNIGNTGSAGELNLTGGVTIESGATLVVNPTSGTSNTCTIELMGGGIANNGTFTAFATNRNLSINVTAGTNVFGGANPLTVNNLTVATANGLTLTQNLAVNGTLSLTTGLLTTGSNVVTLGPVGTVARAAGYVAGKLQKPLATGAVNKTFEIGDVSGYTPVTVAFGSVATAGSITASTQTGAHPQIASSGLNSSKSLNRYYTLVNSGTVYDSYSATFTFVAGDVIGGANTANYVVRKYDGTWTTPTTASPLATSIQATGLTSMSDFAIGEIATWTLTVNAVNGTVTKNPDDQPLGYYAGGTSVQLTAIPAVGYHFVNWTGDASGTANPVTVTMDANKVVTANFAVNQFTITPSVSGSGSITPSGATLVNYGASQQFVFTPAVGHHTDSVVVNGVKVDSVVSYTFINVTTGPQAIAAYFSVNTYTLSVPVIGSGTVTKSPDKALYNYGDTVQLTAVPGSGAVLVGWSGDATGSVNPLTVVMLANKTITATFGVSNLTLTVNATNGSVVKSPDLSGYTLGAVVRLTAVPVAGYHFTGWSGDLSGTANPDSIVMAGNRNVTALFAINQYTITASAGLHGAISPAGSTTTDYGTTVRYTFTPDAQYRVDSVIVDGVNVDSAAGYTFASINANHSLHVTFALLPGTFVIRTWDFKSPNIYPLLEKGPKVAKPWHVEVKNGSGSIIASGDSAILVVPNLTPDYYRISASDSAGWRFVFGEFMLNGIWTAGSPLQPFGYPAGAGRTDTIDLLFQAPSYSQTYRTFKPDYLGESIDNKGKVGKPVLRKNVAVDFSTTLTSPARPNTGLLLKASMISSAVVKNSRDSIIGSWTATKGATITGIDTNATITITGRGTSGKAIKIDYVWSHSAKPTTTKGTAVVTSVLRLPMPDRINVLDEVMSQGGFGSTGIVVGQVKTDVKNYGWFQTVKYSDVLKTVYEKGTFQTASGHGFDYYTSGKPLLKQNKTLPPSKFNNALLANMIGLKLSIAASAMGKTPSGLGELLYQQDVQPANPFNGWMVRDIAAYADSLMMGWTTDTIVKGKTLQNHHFANKTLFENLNSTIYDILLAFEGDVDTVKFGDTLKLTGVTPLYRVTFLRPNSSVLPAIITPLALQIPQEPTEYSLNQNYPNPFNPTTTIGFDLPENAIVTLKIFNILGQEVATLLDRALMDGGTTQEMQFDAHNMASGVYFYRIVAEKVDENGSTTANIFTTTKKMMLLK